MKSKPVVHLCFLIPFVLTVFNTQVFVTLFISSTLAQLMAYGNIGLLFAGIALTIKQQGHYSKTASLWIIFYIIYFVFSIMASAIHYNPAEVLLFIIPLLYILGFYVYLSNPENRLLFRKVALISFVASSILAIHLYNINFDLEKGGIYQYKVDRSQGVYGDANNTALMCIVSFVFLFKLYQPQKKLLQIFRIILLAILFYSLALTFSTTGFVVFIVSLVMLNHKFFTGSRIVIAVLFLPIFYLFLANLNTLTADLNLVGQQREKINNIVNVVTLNTSEIDDSGRNELVKKLINDYVFENPIIGNGLGFGASQRAHNTIIIIWADAGIFTLLFFLFMLFKYFANSINSPPSIRYFVLPILIGLCIFMLSLQTIINQPYLMAVFVYLAYLLDEKDESEILGTA